MAHDASLQIKACTHGGSISCHTWCLTSYQLLHAMQYIQGQWLHARQQHCVAHDVPLRINGCTHGSSIAGHIMPRLKSMVARTVAASFGTHDASHRVSCCMQWLQHSLACGASLHSQGHVPTGYRQLPGGLRQIPARSDLRQAIGPFSFSRPPS